MTLSDVMVKQSAGMRNIADTEGLVYFLKEESHLDLIREKGCKDDRTQLNGGVCAGEEGGSQRVKGGLLAQVGQRGFGASDFFLLAGKGLRGDCLCNQSPLHHGNSQTCTRHCGAHKRDESTKESHSFSGFGNTFVKATWPIFVPKQVVDESDKLLRGQSAKVGTCRDSTSTNYPNLRKQSPTGWWTPRSPRLGTRVLTSNIE
jgi:hypothetical protein